MANTNNHVVMSVFNDNFLIYMIFSIHMVIRSTLRLKYLKITYLGEYKKYKFTRHDWYRTNDPHHVKVVLYH